MWNWGAKIRHSAVVLFIVQTRAEKYLVLWAVSPDPQNRNYVDHWRCYRGYETILF